MQIINNPDRQQWQELLKRPLLDQLQLEKSVRKILARVKAGGDKAVKKFTKEFDGASIRQLRVSEKEIRQAATIVDQPLRNAIATAAQNIERFHAAQRSEELVVETMPGVKCWRRSVAIDKVGLYIPGGTAPLFSTVLMLGIPARLAGCREIVLCTPPQKDGSIHPAILFAAQVAGITSIFKTGGAQAIAAMAYGTESIPPVYKIFGPGNQYVNAAKQLVQLDGLAIDMPAGPSEVCVLADDSVDPSYIAADLLSQAEHGADSQVFLVTTSPAIAQSVKEHLAIQLENLPRKEIALQSLANSRTIVVNNMQDGIELVNEYAAEHLIICCDDAVAMANDIRNAGSVFIGNYSPESVGDYASGTNHVLPTNGFARSGAGVSVDSFVKKITYQQLTREGLGAISQTVITMASAEGLQAHASAVNIRLKKV